MSPTGSSDFQDDLTQDLTGPHPRNPRDVSPSSPDLDSTGGQAAEDGEGRDTVMLTDNTGPAESLPAMTEPVAMVTLEKRFEILERLGEGGMGTVFSAWDHVLEQEVALKSVRPDVTVHADQFERFRNEARVARRIQHVNVAQMYDMVELDGVIYLCMEYVNGRTLGTLIAEEGSLPIHLALGIVRQVASGLQAAHDQGIIHRDLKPANIMVAYDSPRACILDFGIASDIGQEGENEGGLIMGSPRYMSPEQLGGEEIDTRADVYGLGLLFYEMLAGESAFTTPKSLCRKTLIDERRQPPNIRSRLPDLPDYAAETIDRCLAFDRDERFHAPAEILDFLDQQRQGNPLLRLTKERDTTRPRVLVATPDPSVGPTVTARMEALGCETTLVSDGVHALSQLLDASCELIIIDPDLPRIDGVLVHEILDARSRSEQPWVVFLVTTEGERADAARRVKALDIFRPDELDRLSATAKLLLKF